ncbi:hypothetical protein FVE85_8902 [Porphyridium purpureum]|uniref:Uncharacterized protein n=1 Tax=Porphyridium purpureum TaxID=35688 RepID=A0A5J4YSP3_PORPP|nr:hypothetical protein FVE85_8902 [Porphyridium purpureum]|eukprot:POR7707..scf296_7
MVRTRSQSRQNATARRFTGCHQSGVNEITLPGTCAQPATSEAYFATFPDWGTPLRVSAVLGMRAAKYETFVFGRSPTPDQIVGFCKACSFALEGTSISAMTNRLEYHHKKKHSLPLSETRDGAPRRTHATPPAPHYSEPGFSVALSDALLDAIAHSPLSGGAWPSIQAAFAAVPDLCHWLRSHDVRALFALPKLILSIFDTRISRFCSAAAALFAELTDRAIDSFGQRTDSTPIKRSRQFAEAGRGGKAVDAFVQAAAFDATDSRFSALAERLHPPADDPIVPDGARVFELQVEASEVLHQMQGLLAKDSSACPDGLTCSSVASFLLGTVRDEFVDALTVYITSDNRTYWSSQGVQQGDPLGPALFGSALFQFLEQLPDAPKTFLRPLSLYLGDGSSMVSLRQVGAILEVFSQYGPRYGLFVNCANYEIYAPREDVLLTHALVPGDLVFRQSGVSSLGVPLAGSTALNVCKIMHTIRLVPRQAAQAACDALDRAMAQHRQRLLGFPSASTSHTNIYETWLRLPPAQGGAGVRLTSDVALPTFVACAIRTLSMVVAWAVKLSDIGADLPALLNDEQRVEWAHVPVYESMFPDMHAALLAWRAQHGPDHLINMQRGLCAVRDAKTQEALQGSLSRALQPYLETAKLPGAGA